MSDTATTVKPFTITEVSAATGTRCLSDLWERLEADAPDDAWYWDTSRGYPVSYATVYRPTPNDWVRIDYWTHTLAKVVRAVATISAMSPEVRRLADPLWTGIPHNENAPSWRTIATLAEVESAVSWAACFDLIKFGFLPGTFTGSRQHAPSSYQTNAFLGFMAED